LLPGGVPPTLRGAFILSFAHCGEANQGEWKMALTEELKQKIRERARMDAKNGTPLLISMTLKGEAREAYLRWRQAKRNAEQKK
jgi:hypothetical protein